MTGARERPVAALPCLPDVNQFQWTFLDNKRQRHTLGIAHSPTSGHLVVHCDHRVVIIEFSVLEAKEFSFFVEDELCRLNVLGDRDAGFTYNFAIDTDADTEVNRVRNADRKRDARRNVVRSVLLFLAPVVIIGGLSLWGYTSHLARLPEDLLVIGARAQAELLASGEFEFVAGSEVVRDRPVGEDPERLEALDLDAQDFVPVLYYQKDPDYFIVDWRRTARPLPQDSARSRAFAEALFGALDEALPPTAGPAPCALRAALRLAGRPAARSIIDGYLRDDADARARWAARFREPAYQAGLAKVCAPAPVLPSAPD